MKAAVADRATTPQAAPRALPRPAVERLLRDVQADLADYAELAELLEQQFASALRHDGPALEELAERIVAVVDQLDARRQFRIGLVARLTGDAATPGVPALLAQWPAARRGAVQALWDRLEEAVRDCKARNLRNARLMTEQHALLARVLHGPEDTLYADA
ncbi:flagellar protein FlgN [Pseudorhodoferax sp.]|uniref:flagellar protein FlgN n=1 Tax=Pseudorhodoferax sp. TaxID=1993553 RepID=UPI002DD69718|nr:flagellar protein FlgN [Pseudorhodoferax sp.]